LDIKRTLLKNQTNQPITQVENVDGYSWYVFVTLSAVIQEGEKHVYTRGHRTGLRSGNNATAFPLDVKNPLFLVIF